MRSKHHPIANWVVMMRNVSTMANGKSVKNLGLTWMMMMLLLQVHPHVIAHEVHRH
jgi:hypothetical protein